MPATLTEEIDMKTVIVTGASQGIGAAVASLFLERGYNVVANSRRIKRTNELRLSENIALVDGDIALPATAAQLIATAVRRFGSVDALVNNAGILIAKPFIQYTADDFRALASTNLEGLIYITQRVIEHWLAQERGGSVVSISASIADRPLAALPAAVSMITKGGINAISRNLAMEYAKQGIRVNAVAPGPVDTPLLKGISQEFLQSLSPMGVVGTTRAIAEAVLYLTEASQVTGVVLPVDSGAHLGKW
jgi:NAD(P)-dependent dehydrogenase (short-subunit alcohol dehydrogenase family)